MALSKEDKAAWEELVKGHRRLAQQQYQRYEATLQAAHDAGCTFSDLARWTDKSLSTIRMRFNRRGWRDG